MAHNNCPFCNLALNPGAKFCTNCGKQITISPNVVQPAASSPVDALLKRAALVMEDEDWQKADELLEQVLNHDPENAQAYFGKLLANLKLPSAKVLTSKATELGITSLNEYKDYEKALRFADPSFRFILECYNPANLEQICQEVTTLLNPPMSFEKCHRAVKLFDYIPPGYRDIGVFAEQIKYAELVYIEYQKAVTLLKSSKQFDGSLKAISIVGSIPTGYAEVDALIRTCLATIEKQLISDLKHTAPTSGRINALVGKLSPTIGLKEAEAIVTKCHGEYQENVYQEAVAKLDTATTVTDFQDADTKFSFILGYRDADVLREECRKAVKYINACKTMVGERRDAGGYYYEYYEVVAPDLKSAAEQFASISGYKDADKLAVECQEKYLKKTKTIKRYVWTFLIFILVVVGIIVGSSIRASKIAARNKITVYASGYERRNDGTRNAMLWIDGVAQRLGGPGDSIAEAVFVVGKDVYVAGGMKDYTGINVAKIWKNGIAQSLTNGNNDAFANAIYIDGNDVYAAGREKNADDKQRATVWKNGKAQYLSNGITDAVGLSVFVSNGNVYVAGYTKDEKDKHIATLWRNGTEQRLSEPKSQRAWAQSVFVQGSDVYVAGFDTNAKGKAVATLWINGIPYDLSDGSREAVAQSVTISNGDIYVVGQEDYEKSPTVAKLWKNGIVQNVSNVGYGRYSAYANSVCVLEGNVYVAGREVQADDRRITEAMVWKNGGSQRIDSGRYDSRALSVFVTKGSGTELPQVTGTNPLMKIAPRGSNASVSTPTLTPAESKPEVAVPQRPIERASRNATGTVEEVKIPNVRNMTLEEAENALKSAGHVVGSSRYENNNTVPSGKVMEQNVTDIGSFPLRVNLIISSGPAQVLVPRIIGQRQTEAEREITSAGLKVGRVTQDNTSSMPTGCVIGSDPMTGSYVAPGSTVNLRVSSSSTSASQPAGVGASSATSTTATTPTSDGLSSFSREPLPTTEENIRIAKATINRLMPKFTYRNNRNGVSCVNKSLPEFEKKQRESYHNNDNPFEYFSLFAEIKDGKLVAYSRWNHKKMTDVNHNSITITTNNNNVNATVQTQASKVDNVWSLANGLVTEEGLISGPERILRAISVSRYGNVRASIRGSRSVNVTLLRENVDAITETLELYDALNLLTRAGVRIQQKY
ncbi:MAG: PASTA domain-containing protein [Holophagaceae bacterium]|nr:PASTA domain-containing protein [Holophagaceae bacterium]